MHIHNIQRREEDLTLDIGIKYIEVKFCKSDTTFATQQTTDGITLEITDKTPLEEVIIEDNVKKYHQTKGAFPLIDYPPFVLRYWSLR